MLGTSLTKLLKEKEREFDDNFEKIFGLADKVLSLLSFLVICLLILFYLSYPKLYSS